MAWLSPPNAWNVYVTPLFTVIIGMRRSLMYQAIPQPGRPENGVHNGVFKIEN